MSCEANKQKSLWFSASPLVRVTASLEPVAFLYLISITTVCTNQGPVPVIPDVDSDGLDAAAVYGPGSEDFDSLDAAAVYGGSDPDLEGGAA